MRTTKARIELKVANQKRKARRIQEALNAHPNDKWLYAHNKHPQNGRYS